MLAGWSSVKVPLLGSVRASAQMVSYEAVLGLALVAVLTKTGTLSTHNIALSQSGGITDWGLVVTWFVLFFIFFIATTAELNTPPFDLVVRTKLLVVSILNTAPSDSHSSLWLHTQCESIHLRFRICVDARNTTKAKVRPTHGLRMEIAHSSSTWLGNAPRNSRRIQRSWSRQRLIPASDSGYQCRNANLTRRFTHEIHIYWKTQERARRGRGIRMKPFTLTAFSNHLEGNK